MSDDIQPIVIDLNANKHNLVNESFIQAFGDTVKSFLKYMFKDAPQRS